jgi:hypothetical protein
MQYFFKKLLIFLIPVALYMLLVAVVDPYNYFKISKGIVKDEIKRKIAYEISNPLYQLIEFEKEPTPYILLGSSQTGLFIPPIIKEYTGKQFMNMSYGGGTMPEIISTFWELSKYTQLKEVYIGISFIDFNGSQYRNRVPEAVKIKSNFFSYIFSKSTLKSTLLILKAIIFNSKVEIGKPDMSAEKFWQYQLDVTANRFLTGHTYPAAYYESFKEIAEYCNKNNIKLVFFIPAGHVDLQKKTPEFNMQADEIKFKEDVKKLGDVYDFNFPNALTEEKNNFSDPFHFKDEQARTMVDELFNDKRKLSVFSKCESCKTGK